MRRRRPRFLVRWFLRPLLIVSVLLALVLAGGFYWLTTSLPQTKGTIVLGGLKAPVEILRDGDGVPHILAANAADAMMALGFVHAQDRLWQMEQMRRFGRGRLSEIAGEATLPLDRFARTVGLERLAEAALAGLDPTLRAGLEAYAAGVNAFLARHRGAWPPEFILLGLTPEPWRPVDSMLWSELMAVQLSGHWGSELLRAKLLKTLTPAEVDELWPPYPLSGPTTLAADLVRGPPLERLAEAADGFAGHGASNAWVVDGAHSATGKPLLANDPHLGFSLPILWYLARIDTPELHLAGATVPGVPLFVLGHNDRIAWGMSTTGGDVEDLFVEKLAPDDPERYLAPDGPRPFRTRNEVIAVRGKSAVTIEVRETRHGPVISDAVEDVKQAAERGTVLALSATWLDPENGIAEAVYRLDMAHNWNEATAALEQFNAPEQNVIYADVDGHIGFYAAGNVPVRKAGDGRLPVEGWSGEYDWLGIIPFAELPHGLDPPSGRFANANNKVTPPDYPHLITRDGWDSPYRAARLATLLDATPKATLDDFARMQADAVSLAARELLPYLLDVEISQPNAKAVLERMRQWDGTMARERLEPLVFTAWLGELNRGLFEARLGENFRHFFSERPALIASIFSAHQAWCAKPGAAAESGDCRARSGEALGRALGWLSAHYGSDWSLWRWGDAHQAQFVNQIFERIPVINRLVNLHLPADGGNFTLNRGGFAIDRERAPFADIHGAGFRGLYDLSDLDRSRFMIATGQSGNPLSPHFTDLAQRWRDVDSLTLAGTRAELIAAGASLLTLTPQ
ncbi:MAG: penicillin acylase family protein [Alphaproteobacteria bacterium]